MAETPLSWGNVSWTNWYHFASQSGPKANLKQLVYPWAAGRDALDLGQMQTDETSFSCAFAEEGVFRNRIVAASVSDLVNAEGLIRNAAKNYAVSTLTTYAGSWSNMRLDQLVFIGGPIHVIGAGYGYHQIFAASFTQWY